MARKEETREAAVALRDFLLEEDGMDYMRSLFLWSFVAGVRVADEYHALKHNPAAMDRFIQRAWEYVVEGIVSTIESGEMDEAITHARFHTSGPIIEA